MKSLLRTFINLIFLIALASCSEEATKQKHTTIEGEWEFNTSSFSGQFAIEMGDTSLEVTKGNYTISGVNYQILVSIPVTDTYIELYNSLDNKLTLLYPQINKDFDEILINKVEYDTDTGPTISQKVAILIKRK